jgi:hypothetical protein
MKKKKEFLEKRFLIVRPSLLSCFVKKNDGSWGFCVDYTKLYEITDIQGKTPSYY